MNISKQSQERIDWLTAMPAAAKFEAIAMKIENPAIFSQFIALDEDALVWDYAYAAGLISKADADFAKAREAAESEGGENQTGPEVITVPGGESTNPEGGNTAQ